MAAAHRSAKTPRLGTRSAVRRQAMARSTPASGGAAHLDVDFGPVECAIAWVEVPVLAGRGLQMVQRTRQLRLRVVPHLDLPQEPRTEQQPRPGSEFPSGVSRSVTSRPMRAPNGSVRRWAVCSGPVAHFSGRVDKFSSYLCNQATPERISEHGHAMDRARLHEDGASGFGSGCSGRVT